MPKPRIYHYAMTLRLKRKQQQAIQAYAKQRKLGLAEAIRELVEQALDTPK